APLESTENIRVAIGHGQIHGWGDAEKLDAIDLKNVEDNINNGVIDYLALGDTHSTMELGRTGSVWVSGAPETTDLKHLPIGGGESASGSALVVTTDKNSATDDEVSVVKEAIVKWV